jgi:hypothetical protein
MPQKSLLTLLQLAILAYCALAQTSSGTLSVTVNDPRPLAAALLQLEPELGIAFNYEDCPTSNSDAVANAAPRLLSDEQLASNPSAQLLVPRGGSLSWSSQRPLALNAGAVRVLLQSLVDVDNLSDTAGRFQVESNAGTFFIIPSLVAGASGRPVPARALFDTPVSFPPGTRSAADTIDLIIASLNANGKQVALAMAPWNALRNTSLEIESSQETARSVLGKILSAVSSTSLADGSIAPLLGYSLLYDPGAHFYALNIHRVRIFGHAPTMNTVRPAGPSPYAR